MLVISTKTKWVWLTYNAFTMSDVLSGLTALAAEVRKCQLCQLANGRINAVPGDGPPTAEIMLIGEGPGMNEDKHGLPFVGVSGKFLTELLSKAGYKREEVFITNVVKCRPPQNRDPLPEEMSACNGYLARQIALINPKIIVTLGRFSMSKFFPNERISVIHGQARKVNGRVVVAMYHPAAALHQPALRATLEQDFANLKPLIANVQRTMEKPPVPKAVVTASAPPPPKQAAPNDKEADENTQLSLF